MKSMTLKLILLIGIIAITSLVQGQTADTVPAPDTAAVDTAQVDEFSGYKAYEPGGEMNAQELYEDDCACKKNRKRNNSYAARKGKRELNKARNAVIDLALSGATLTLMTLILK